MRDAGRLALSPRMTVPWGYLKNLESLNEVGRIEAPPIGAPIDATGEAQFIEDRIGAQWRAEVIPLDLRHYPKKGYPHVDYTGCSFSSANHVIIAYGVYKGKDGLANGNKLLIHPVQWLYES